MSPKRFTWQDIVAVFVPMLLYFILSIKLFDWLIDDAGISFVYARNLASGHGLVTQPGVPPVEGYSNPLWIFLMTPFFLLGLFDPFVTSKAVSLILVALTFLLIHKLIKELTESGFFVSLILLFFLSINASFVIWTSSGLENPLFAMLIVLLLYSLIKLVILEGDIRKGGVLIGLITGAVALTRPDGLVYLIVYPIVLATSLMPFTTNQLRKLLKGLGFYVLTFVASFGSYLVFRISYFGEFFPNTYYVKGGPTFTTAIKALTLQEPYLTKSHILLKSIFGQHFWLVVPVMILLWIGLVIVRDRGWLKSMTVLFVTGLSGFTYLILINDWMGEYRLATPVFPLLYILLAIAGYQFYKSFTFIRTFKLVVLGIILAVLAVSSMNTHYNRLTKFADKAPASFSSIASLYGKRFNQYAEYLELDGASLLLPYIGGTLYYSNLRIFDLAGLCDPVIARTYRNDLSALHNHVFDDLKPTFLHTHGWFTATMRLDEDPRFERDYVGITTYEDRYAEKRLKRKVMSGNFIRREAVAGKEDLFRELAEGKPD
jgi:hypothetical protein